MNVLEIIFAIGVSFGVGILSAVFGVGGGFILVPVLNGMLGIPMHLAVGSTACYVLGPATTALLYRDVRIGQWRLPLILTGGLLIGVAGGSSFLNTLIGDDAATSTRADTVVLATYLVLLSVLGLFSIWETYRASRYRPLPRGWILDWRLPPLVTVAEVNGNQLSIPMLAWFGVFVGFLSGLLGISGGLLILPGLLYLFAFPAQPAVICSLIIVWLVSFQSTVAHAMLGNVRLELVAALLAGGTIGARLGTSVGKRLKSQQLRRSFGFLALGTAGFVAVRLASVLWTRN